uniref:Uncharacterized protein n=1 Tax=viral metagenome TaxID=1070528 RepID=A0A6C0J8Q8_9ZZZZ
MYNVLNNELLTDNIQCYLDARYSSSINSKQGNTYWKDLSGKNNHFNFNNPIVSDGFRVDMHASGHGKSTNIEDFNITDGYTIVIVCHDKSHTSGSPFYISSSDNNIKNGISAEICSPNGTVSFTHMNKNMKYKLNNSTEEHMYVFTRSVDGMNIYIDGAKVTTNTGETINPKLRGNIRIGKNIKWNADMKVFIVYNKRITDENIVKLWEWYKETDSSAPDRVSKERRPSMKHLVKGIRKKGLVLAIDAANHACYPGKGKIVTDLARGLKFDLNRIATIKHGAFINKGDFHMSGPMSTELGINGYDDFTVVFRCKTTKLSHGVLLHLFGYEGPKERGMLIAPTGTNGKLTCNIGGKHKISVDVNANYNKMQTYVFTRNSNGRDLYINGKLVKHNDNVGGQLRLSSKPMIIFKSPLAPNYYGELSHLYIYNVGLTEHQIHSISTVLDNPYMVGKSTWKKAQHTCKGLQKTLSPLRDLCMNGKAIDHSLYKHHGALAPINDMRDTWVNLSNCKIYKNSGIVNKAHIKCSEHITKKHYFDSITSLTSTETKILYIFGNKHLATYDISNHKLHKMNRPYKIIKYFKGLSEAFVNPDTVCIASNKLYMFLDDKVTVIDLLTKKVVTKPIKLETVFPKLHKRAMKGNLDSVLYTGYYFIFFKGAVMYTYDPNKETTTKENIASMLKDASKISYIESHVDAATMINDEMILYKGKYAYNTKTKKTVPILSKYMDIKVPFVTVKQRCKVIHHLLPELNKRMEEFNQTHPKHHSDYKKHIKILEKERKQICGHRNAAELNKGIANKQKRIHHLTNSIKKYKELNQSAITHTDKYNKQIIHAKKRINALKNKIVEEKAKQCPVSTQCKSTINNIDTKNEKCDTNMIKATLHKKGYTMEQLTAISDKAININDFDIRTHKDFHKLIDSTNIKSCPGDSLADLKKKKIGAFIQNMNDTMNASNPGSDSTHMIDTTLGKQDLQQASSVNEMDKATKKMASNIDIDNNIAQHLRILKDIQSILSKTKGSKNYKVLKTLQKTQKITKVPTLPSISAQVTDLQQQTQSTKALLKELHQ